MTNHLARAISLIRRRARGRQVLPAYPGGVFDTQHTADDLTQYEVARELLGRQLGLLLEQSRQSDDAAVVQRLRDEAREIEQRRQELRVGSAEAAEIVATAKAQRRAASLPLG